jgi:Flp pilus assembly protein CpaB
MRADHGGGPGPRPLGRRHHLPGGRAVVGGLLVTLAAVATFVAHTAASTGPTASVVVVTRPISVGEHLDAADLRVVPADLPGEVQATFFGSTTDLDGAVALSALATDQPVGRTDVSLSPTADVVRTHDLSFALERDRALNARLRPGELVDLVATFGTGADATTVVVVRRVPVADLDAPATSSAGSSAKVTITLAFASESDVLLAANALEVANVTLTRATGTVDEGAPVPIVRDDRDAVVPAGSSASGPGPSTSSPPPPSSSPPSSSSAASDQPPTGEPDP